MISIKTKGTVKSVQRGTFSGSWGAGATKSIVISTINANKSVLLIDGYVNKVKASDGDKNFPISLTNNAITLKNNDATWSATVFFNWQVIEFY